MERNALTKIFFRVPALQILYRFEWVKRLYQSFVVASVPAPQYYIELANRCNAECIFCSYPVLRDQGKVLVNMTDEVFSKSLAMIDQQRCSVVSFTPTTGEIFMNPKWAHYVQRVLDLDFVKDVHFYTNGALLDDRNREEFFRLRNLDKLSLSFSSGGTDRETYRLMFGKDLFHHVQKNINGFLRHLKNEGMAMQVSIDVKLAKQSQASWRDCVDVYNECGYSRAFVKIRDRFDDLGGLIQEENIQRIDPIPEARRKKPCQYLDDVRFASNGEIWLCGCVDGDIGG